MKLTKTQLKRIIKEELAATLDEGFMDTVKSFIPGTDASATRKLESLKATAFEVNPDRAQEVTQDFENGETTAEVYANQLRMIAGQEPTFHHSYRDTEGIPVKMGRHPSVGRTIK